MKGVSALVLLATFVCAQAYNDVRCTNRGGNCKYMPSHCDGIYVSNLCGGPSNRRCCVPYDDSKCTARRGKCQMMTSEACVGGNYVSSLCGGPRNRRCCIKNSGGQGGQECSQDQKRMACALLSGPRKVQAATRHPSGIPDDAYAFNNLRDVCDGKKASRSSYRSSDCACNAPGGKTCLSSNLLRYLTTLKNIVNRPIIINEIAGACHSCKSRHYSGLAVDLHKIEDLIDTYMTQCEAHGGWVKNERNHIHCQFYDGPHPNWL